MNNIKLTKTEREVLHLLINEFLTIKQVSICRKTKVQAVYKIIKKLKKKGAYNDVKKIGTNIGGTFTLNVPKSNKIRLHGQEFNIKILYKDQRYKNTLSKSNIQIIDGNTIKLYNNSIEIYSGKSFYADSVHKATYKSFEYWTRIFNIIENDLKIIILKSRVDNINLVNSHYSEINNEIARDYEYRGDKLRVYAKDDGKLCCLIDNSFNLHELEWVHPKTSKPDAERAVSFISDLRENPEVPNLSELSIILKELINQNKETASGLKATIDILKTHLEKEYNINKVPVETKGFKEKADYIG